MNTQKEIMTLISNVPDSQDIDSINDWFTDVKIWADKNNQSHLSTDATNPDRVTEYRRKILSQLKSLAKDEQKMITEYRRKILSQLKSLAKEEQK